MKQFTSAVEDIEVEDDREAREARIAVRMAGGETREEAEAAEPEVEKFVEFELDGRVMKAYQPHEGQLAFMLASLGRGQTKEGRFAAIINVMLECLRDDDKDHLEHRLLTGGKDRIRLKTLEGIFEYLTEEWFRKDVP